MGLPGGNFPSIHFHLLTNFPLSYFPRNQFAQEEKISGDPLTKPNSSDIYIIIMLIITEIIVYGIQ